MKEKVTKLAIVLAIILGSISCKVSYQNTYYTSLDGAPTESLIFEDSLVRIKFNPKPNGIVFDIENLTNNNLYLIWDKSYFVAPDGNTTKLLNTDLLETSAIIRDKENYESIIPQKGHFQRFTCSATNISKFSSYDISTIYNEASKTITSTAAYSDFYLTGVYWYSGTKRKFSTKKDIPNLDKQEISAVQRFLLKNDNLGLGFTIKSKNEESEYHFKFPIKHVLISKKTSDDMMFTESHILERTNEFNPVAIEN